jgi:hypothetical protein
VSEPVPPFELPIAQATVDTLFIPVLAVENRDACMRFYEYLAHSKGLAFDTKVTVINKALEKPLNERIPVCTVQLNGECLIEIDEVKEFRSKPRLEKGLVNGIAMISFLVEEFPDNEELIEMGAELVGTEYEISGRYYAGKKGDKKARLIRGLGGELIELICEKNYRSKII